jgi:hypothetical protein
MPFRGFRSGLEGTFGVRMQRAKAEGSWRGSHEAKLFMLAAGEPVDRIKALDWLSTAVDEGRAELEAQHATEREIEAWDMACRIAFLLEIV